MPKVRKVRNGPIQIHYKTYGDKRKPPLVLLHGLTDSLQCWEDEGYVEVLKKDYFLILIDARGHGKSDKPKREKDYHAGGFRLLAADVAAVLRRVTPRKKVHLLGYSFGGTIAFAVAKYYPSRLRTLIIVDEPPKVWSRWMPENRKYVLKKLRAARRKGPEPIVDMWREQMPKGISPRLAKRVSDNDPEALLALCGKPWPNFNGVARRLKVPCLVYAGMADKKTYKAAKKSVGQISSEITFVAREGLNHVQSLLQAKLLLNALTPFLEYYEKLRLT